MCICLDTCAYIYVRVCMHVCIHPFWSLPIYALRHSSRWRTCLQESWRGRSWWCVFNNDQGPQTCTRTPTQHSDALALAPTSPHLTSLHFTSLHFNLTCSPQLLHRCCLPPRTPQAATTSANRKRDAPSPEHWHQVAPGSRRALLRPPTSLRLA